MSTKRSRRALCIGLAALGATMAVQPGSAVASSPADSPAAANFEKTFLAETIDHHFMGVKMGRLCMDKARSRRLADICTAIVVTQAEEIVRMRDDFLLDWYGVEKHPALMATDVQDLQMLKKRKGKAFDIALSKMFIDHHELQISRSTACLQQAEHHELKHLCMDQIETQSTEIQQFRGVLRSYRGKHSTRR